MTKILLQGDIKLTSCEKPKKAELIFSGKEYTLAVGEISGHAHIVRVKERGEVRVFKDAKGQIYLHIDGVGTLTHEGTGTEHGTHKIVPDWYKVGGGESAEMGEREWDYFENSSRQTID